MQTVRARSAQGKLGATSLALVPRVDTRTQGVLRKETDQQDDRQKMIDTLLRTIVSDVEKEKLRWELEESRYNEYALSSVEAKEKFHSQGNSERFELCVLSQILHLAICFVDAVQFSQRRTKFQKHLQSLVK